MTNSLNLGAIAGVTLAANKEMAKSAAYLEAGRIVNNKLVQVVTPKLPMLARGYAQTPVGKLAMANLMLMGVQRFKPENQQLAKLGYAAVTQAYTEAFQSLDIEGLIDGFLKDSAIASAMGVMERADASAE